MIIGLSIKHIADIAKELKNPSFVVLQALAKALALSLDNLIGENLSTDEQGLNQLKAYYLSCPSEMRETLLNTIHALTKELFPYHKNEVYSMKTIEYVHSPHYSMSSVFFLQLFHRFP